MIVKYYIQLPLFNSTHTILSQGLITFIVIFFLEFFYNERKISFQLINKNINML